MKVNYPKEAGIYKLTCINNGKIYIGKSVNIYNRLGDHRRCAKKTKGDYYFENALIKHGWDSFTVEILEIIDNFDKLKDKEILLDKESRYIEEFNSTDKSKGYNVCKYSTDGTGIPKPPCSEEHKLKISLSKKGKSNGPHTEESIEKMRQSKLGRKRPEFSEEWKQNIGKGHLGMVMSDESKEKISLASRGKPKSKEAVEKMRQSLIGRTHSDETKEKMSRSQQGKTHTEEVKERLRQINLGRKMTSEDKEKMSNAQKGNTNRLGKSFSEESKKKMRESRLAYIAKQKLIREELENITNE